MNQKNQDNGVKKNVLAAALGALVGGIAGILFAPKSGKETRGDIKEAVEKATVEIKEKAEEVRDLTVEKYQAIVDEVTEGYQELRELSAEKLGEIREDLYKNYQKIKKGGTKTSA